MFRKQYKGAYNEIKGNRALIDKIFTGEVKSQKKKIIPFKYATTLVAAMIALVIVVGYPNFTEYSKPEIKELTPVDINEYQLPKLENATISSVEQTKTEDNVTVNNSTNFYVAEEPAVPEGKGRMIQDVSVASEPAPISTDTVILENGKIAVRIHDFDADEILARIEESSNYIIDEEDGKQTLYVKAEDTIHAFQFYDFSEQDILALIESI